MINEELTFEKFGYYSTDLKQYSHKKIIVICNKCKKKRIITKHNYANLCKSCASKNFKHSKETKERLSNINNGNKHPNWNPNLTDEDREIGRRYPKYYEWRKTVFERDDYTCQVCGNKSGILNAHHLEGYSNNPKLRTTLENGITLCKECHKNFHHCYGYGNNTKEQFIEFMR